MTDLLEACPIEQRQSVHVLGFGAGRLPEMLVWHQHGPSCIIGETYLEEFARGLRSKIGIRSHLSDGLSQRHHCDLIRLIETGFKGCVFKSDIYKQLEAAINKVSEGKFYIPGNIQLTLDEDE